MDRCVWMSSLLVLIATGCNRSTEGMQLQVEGQIHTVPSGEPVAGADWTLFERAVEDGALQAEEEVAAAESDGLGQFSTEFPRRSSYSLRWTSEAAGHFTAAGTLDPDELLPGEPAQVNVSMNAVCTLHVQLASLAPEDSTDRLAFNLGEDFPCACCPTDVLVLEGVGADSSWSCLMHGDRWMTWGADLEVALIGQPDGIFIDSTFCPAFGSANLNLTW